MTDGIGMGRSEERSLPARAGLLLRGRGTRFTDPDRLIEPTTASTTARNASASWAGSKVASRRRLHHARRDHQDHLRTKGQRTWQNRYDTRPPRADRVTLVAPDGTTRPAPATIDWAKVETRPAKPRSPATPPRD
jgi:hypothetical protein